MKVVFKARLGTGPVQVVGSYEMSDEEWEEELLDFDGDEESWLQNRGADWAYDAVRSDCLQEWAELEKSVQA
jgi:hypothetical protein